MIKEALKRCLLSFGFIQKMREKRDKAIEQKRLRAIIENCHPLKIVIGAGQISAPGWIPTEYHQLDICSPRDWEKLFIDRKIEILFAEHVFEHLTMDQARVALALSKKYLAPKGRVRIAVPDGFHPSKNYIDSVKVGGDGPGADDHKILFTFKTLESVLKSVGFKVEFLEYFDEHGEFHFKEWNVEDGKVMRSKKFDSRNTDGKLNYTSIIVDGYLE